MPNNMEVKARWALPDRRAALDWCAGPNAAGISCILDVLGRHSQDEAGAKRPARASIAALRAIDGRGLKASLSVKLTTLGASSDSSGGSPTARSWSWRGTAGSWRSTFRSGRRAKLTCSGGRTTCRS